MIMAVVRRLLLGCDGVSFKFIGAAVTGVSKGRQVKPTAMSLKYKGKKMECNV